MRNVVHGVKLIAHLIFIYYLQQLRNIIVIFVISPMLFSHFSKISPMFLSCLNLSNVYTIVFNLSAFSSWSSKLLLVLILKIRDVFLRIIFCFWDQFLFTSKFSSATASPLHAAFSWEAAFSCSGSMVLVPRSSSTLFNDIFTHCSGG